MLQFKDMGAMVHGVSVHVLKHGVERAKSSFSGGGLCPNRISQLRSSKFGTMCTGIPQPSSKNRCVGTCGIQAAVNK